jgi:hypothetical protein
MDATEEPMSFDAFAGDTIHATSLGCSEEAPPQVSETM